LHQRALYLKEGQWCLACGAVHALTSHLGHPGASLLVEVGEIAELAQRQEVSFDVFDSGFDDPFFCGS
jgi:hypothetical protein